jgi:hypothetical protein
MHQLKNILETKKGLLFIVFTSPNCTPCNNCKARIHAWIEQFDTQYTTVHYINIMENKIIYDYYKNKRLLSGIPAIIVFTENNFSYIYNDSINTSNSTIIDTFFNKWLLYSINQYKKKV